MGLDTYAANPDGRQLTDEQKKAFARAHIRLRSFIPENNGSYGHFRGKVYAHLIKTTTGVDLYQERIHPLDVGNVLHNITLAIDDLIELEKFFRVCVDEGLELQGDW